MIDDLSFNTLIFLVIFEIKNIYYMYKKMSISKHVWLMCLGLVFFMAVLIFTAWYYAEDNYNKWATIILDLCTTIIGAFLGFFTALFLNQYSQNIREQCTKNQYIELLTHDIKQIKETLDSIAINSDDGKINFQSLNGMYLHFELPVWSALVSTGEIKLFSKEPYFIDICSLTAKIESYNNLQNYFIVVKQANRKDLNMNFLEQKLQEIYSLCMQIERSINK